MSQTIVPQTGCWDPQIGRCIAERYVLKEKIGSGSICVLYRALDVLREELCCVKLLNVAAAQDRQLTMRFCDEARIIASLCHPNIVALYDAGQEPDQTLYLVMELLRGHDLAAELAVHPQLALNEAIELVCQVGSALHSVHLSGVVHRDIKPSNIFLAAPTERVLAREKKWQVKVIDFGLSKLARLPADAVHSQGLFIGSPAYVPPEGWQTDVGAMGLDASADQWSLAVLAYRLIAGHLPFAQSPSEPENLQALGKLIQLSEPPPLRCVSGEVPAHIQATIKRAMAKNRKERFPTMLDFVRALQQLPTGASLRLAKSAAQSPQLGSDQRAAVTPEQARSPRTRKYQWWLASSMFCVGFWGTFASDVFSPKVVVSSLPPTTKPEPVPPLPIGNPEPPADTTIESWDEKCSAENGNFALAQEPIVVTADGAARASARGSAAGAESVHRKRARHIRGPRARSQKARHR